MSRFMLHLCGTLALCLSIGLGAQTASALSGPEVVQQLNRAYTSTPDRCVGSLPAYYCSGVMLKQVLDSDPLPFWSHGPDAIQRGAERFDYLRRDITPGPLMENHGYLFVDRFTAIGQGKDYQLQGDDGMSRPPQLLVLNWGATPPARLPVAAVYHQNGSAPGLKAALRDQRSYHEATGEWLSVVRLAHSDSRGQIFGFDLNDQGYYGYQVAAKLNQRFADRVVTCPSGKSALYCSGVIIRGTGYGGDFYSWNPTDNSNTRNGVSFSYVRQDVGTNETVGTEGLIFHELDRPSAYKVHFRCAYPFNAGTSGVPDSCRASCVSQNITTVAAWQAAYAGSPGSSCTFGDTPTEFQLNTDVRVGHADEPKHNELIIGAWPQDIPTQLPIAAFYWEAGSNGLAGARHIQNDYLEVTGRFMPIIRVDLKAALGFNFQYFPVDQSY